MPVQIGVHDSQFPYALSENTMKICPKCNQAASDSTMFCATCGNPLGSVAPSAAPPAPPQSMLEPPSSPRYASSPSLSQRYAQPPTSQPLETSGLAIASLICGCLFFIFPTAVLAIIFGHISRSQIAKSANRIGGAGIALAGMILGYIGIAILPFILIVAAIAVPNLLRARIAANEASTVGSSRTIAIAAVTYSSEHGSFPPSLEAIGPAPVGANLVDRMLASGQRSGYTFEYRLTTSQAGQPGGGFVVTADPIRENQTGMRHFFLDETGVIRQQREGPAGKESPPIN